MLFMAEVVSWVIRVLVRKKSRRGFYGVEILFI